MSLGGRVGRAETAEMLRERRRLAIAMCVSPEQVTTEDLAESRRIAAKIAEWRRSHPLPVDADGRCDVEPDIRALAVELGLDPDEMVAEASRVLERLGAAGLA